MYMHLCVDQPIYSYSCTCIDLVLTCSYYSTLIIVFCVGGLPTILFVIELWLHGYIVIEH